MKQTLIRRPSRAVPVNYRENWAYRGKWSEKKIAPSKWAFTFTATKRRKAKSYGNMPKGTRGIWGIRALQYIEKTGLGEYQTKMIGTKKAIKFVVPKRKKRGLGGNKK